MTTPQHQSAPLLTPPASDPNLYGRNLRIETADGDEGARAMVQAMRAIVHDSARTTYVADLAKRIESRSKKLCDTPLVERTAKLNHLTRPFASRLIELHRTLQGAQVFTQDPPGMDMPRHVDQLAHEILTREQVACDCDCLAMVGAAVARTWGCETAFVLVGDHAQDHFRHVFYAVKVGRRWVPFDPQTNTRPFEWPVRAVRREIILVD